jgi:HEAT repeat protein
VAERATPAEILRLRHRSNAAGLARLLDTNEARDSWKVRRDIAFELGRIPNEPARPALRELAEHDESQAVRLQALAALARGADRESIAVFAAALGRERSARVRMHAVRGLYATRMPDAVPPLISALEDRSAGIRSIAAYALARIGDPAALVPLERAARTWRPVSRLYLRRQLALLRRALR